MDNIYEIIKSPQWWVTVVIAGIGINLLSGYLKNSLDSRFSKMSKWWQSRSIKKVKEREEFVARLASNDKLFALNSIRHIDSIKYTLIWMLLGISIFFLAKVTTSREEFRVFFMLMGSLSFYRGFLFLFKSSYYASCAEDSVDDGNT